MVHGLFDIVIYSSFLYDIVPFLFKSYSIYDF